jgi:hypothetical protein
MVFGSDWYRERATRGVSFARIYDLFSSQDLRFEMLAFKSDVSHWRKKDELTGVSVRYVSDVNSVHGH